MRYLALAASAALLLALTLMFAANYIASALDSLAKTVS